MLSPPILVTGATGFVGRVLVRQLLASGVAETDLRLLVRDLQKAVLAGLPEAALWRGDLREPASLAAVAAGVSVAFHLAGAVTALSAGGFALDNVTGTRHLLAALGEGSPGCRLVQVSSLAAAGPSIDGRGTDAPPSQTRPTSAYGQSKRGAELELCAMGGALRWLVVRPPVIYGPGDAATRLMFRQATAPLVVVPRPPRPLSVMHVDDVVRALLLAGASPATERFLPLDGPERLDTDRLMVEMALACGRRARLLRLPTGALWPAGFAADVWHRLRRRPGFFGVDKLRDLSGVGWVADPEAARRTLGFTASVPHASGLRAAAIAEGFAAA